MEAVALRNEMELLRYRLLIQQYIKNAEKLNQELYKELLTIKLNDGLLSFDEITRDILESLYLNEGLTDKQLATLYEVDGKIVREKRDEWGIVKELRLLPVAL